MFTGLIQEIGTIISARTTGGGASVRFEIAAPLMAPSLKPGESVAVDGCCLTVETRTDRSFVVFASEETLSRTTLGADKHAANAGSRVNLERALAVGDRAGGHWVSGHVDGVGSVAAIQSSGGRAWLLRFDVPEELAAQLIPKGSIAIDGVSLTIARLEGTQVEVAVIPETLKRTTLGLKREGGAVNIETDMIGKYVISYLERVREGVDHRGRAAALTAEKLREAGF